LGLDLARLLNEGRFAFIDGLSELFDLPGAAPPPAPAALQIARTLPVRSPQLQVPQIPTSPKRSSGDDIKRLHVRGHGVTALDSLQKEILTIVENVRTQGRTDRTGHQKTEILLVIDQPDFLLAAMGTGQGIGASEMQDWLMGLEQAVHSTILTLSADSPLLHNASAWSQQQVTPLETEHTNFVVALCHRARMVIQLRNLDTGVARDVSGVLRTSRGGAWEEQSKDGEKWEEKEVLYFIQRDAGVRVFERGE